MKNILWVKEPLIWVITLLVTEILQQTSYYVLLFSMINSQKFLIQIYIFINHDIDW